MEGTLALIKPDVAHKEEQIMELIRAEGFLVVEKARFR
jgi:nucleoside diphosphate kinase